MYTINWSMQKIVYATFGALVSFTADVHTAMLGLLICIVVDTITGFIAAPYRGERRESRKLNNLVKKIITYFSAALLLLVVEKLVFPTYLVNEIQLARIAFMVFSMLEVYSCAENARDITGLRIFEIITQLSVRKIQEKTGIDIGAVAKETQGRKK